MRQLVDIQSTKHEWRRFKRAADRCCWTMSAFGFRPSSPISLKRRMEQMEAPAPAYAGLSVPVSGSGAERERMD